MTTTFPAYPATTLAQSEELLIFSGNQMHDVINGDALSEVLAEDGNIPTVRKAITDNYYFKSPIAWAASSTETIFNQLRSFTDGSWWWAPQATTTNPINMGASPYNDVNWKAWSKDQLATYQNAKRLAAEAGFNMVTGSFYFGGTLNNPSDVLFYEGDGKYYSWAGSFPKVVSAGSTNSDVNWVDESTVTLRTQLSRIASFVSATEKYRLTDYVSVYDFGYIGDGTYHAIQEWIDSGKFANIAAVQLVYPKATSAAQSIDWVAIQTACDYAKGRNVFIPKSVGVITDTVVVPKGTTVYGEGKYDIWSDDTTIGTVIITTGSGNPQRWVDITGSDLTDDTPMFVAGGSSVYFKSLALKSTDWSIGLFFPSVKQCGFSNVVAKGFTDACVYLDATWSDRNTILKALHTDVVPDSGMNEFSGFDYYLRATGAGAFGIKIQGTTRSGTSVATSSEWLWGWGGTSDVRFGHGRLSAEGVLGGCYSHDVQLFGATSYGQGISFVDTSFRLAASAKYYCKFNRSARHTFSFSYAETGSAEEPVISITTNTINGNGEIILLADDMNGQIEIDGVLQGSISSRSWQNTRTISRIGADGRMALPCIHGVGTVNSSLPLQLTTFHEDGLGDIGWDDGISRSPLFRWGKTFFRPETALGAALGTTSYPWSTVNASRLTYSSDLVIDPSGGLSLSPAGVLTLGGTSVNETFIIGTTATPVLRPISDGFASLGTVTYPWLNVRAHNLFSDSGTVSVSDRNLKKDVDPIPEEVLDAWGDVNWIQYRLINGTSNRLHSGLIAQQILEAFEARGLDASEYGVVCYDEPEDETGEGIWQVRYSEAEAFESAYQRRRADRLEARLLAIEERLSNLESL